MKTIKFFSAPAIKFFKGFFVLSSIWLLASIGIFIFDSCNKAKYENSRSGEAARAFTKALDAAKNKVDSIILENSTTLQRGAVAADGTYYVDFPSGTNPEIISNFNNNPTIQTLTTYLEDHNVSINDTLDSNFDVAIQVPIAQVATASEPLVVEAKNYLLAKGATNQDITNMLQEEGSQEIDLIPFVKALVSMEEGQNVVRKISIPFVNEANALPRVLECGVAALGGDALYALSQSTASAWTWGAIKSAFKTVAKKFLGPIGVAVAVISFGVCMLG